MPIRVSALLLQRSFTSILVRLLRMRSRRLLAVKFQLSTFCYFVYNAQLIIFTKTLPLSVPNIFLSFGMMMYPIIIIKDVPLLVVPVVCFDSHPAASIWFENWGVVDPGEKNSIFSGNFTKIIDFSGQISDKFRFFSGKFFLKIQFFQAI